MTLTKDAAKLRDKLAALFSDVVMAKRAEVEEGTTAASWASLWQPGFASLSEALKAAADGRQPASGGAARLGIACDKIAAGVRAYVEVVEREGGREVGRDVGFGVVNCDDLKLE